LNDDFSNALQVTNRAVTGSTRGATLEPGEAALGHANSVWYRWVPNASGRHELGIWTRRVPMTLSLYEGSSLETLRPLKRIESPASESMILVSIPVSLEAFKAYYISVSGGGPGGENFEFNLSLPDDNLWDDPALNDDFLDAQLISGTNVMAAGSTFGATRELGEPPHTPLTLQRTVWWKWTAPTTGGFYLRTPQSAAAPEFAIYEGASLSNLQLIASVSPVSGSDAYVSFVGVAGHLYQIVALTDGPQLFSFTLSAAPKNDDFENRLSIPLTITVSAAGVEESIEASGNTMGATLQPGERTLSEGARTIWHQFTAPDKGTYVLFCKPGAAVVYRGTSLTNLTLANPSQKNPGTMIAFRVEAGEQVPVAIESEAPLDYSLQIVRGNINDDFADRINLNNSTPVHDPLWSTTELGEPIHSTDITGGTLWWKWSPSESGFFRLQLVPYYDFDKFPGVLAVYKGTALSELKLVGKAESRLGEPLMLDFFAQKEENYSFALISLAGSISLSLELYPSAENDSFENALPLRIGETSTNTLVLATTEPGEEWSAGKGTVWYAWKAPADGPFIFSASTDGTTPVDLAVFAGSSASDQPLILQTNSSGFLGFHAKQGITYRFAIATLPEAKMRTIRATVSSSQLYDDFGVPALLSGRFLAWTNTTVGATIEQGEENLGSDGLTPSVWAQWVAPESGPFNITFRRFETSFEAAVFRGDFISAATKVSYRVGAAVQFAAERGTVYHIRVASAPQAASQFRMHLGPAEPNDTAATATELSGIDVIGAAWNWTATGSTYETANRVWWKWTAPDSGILYFSRGTNAANQSLSIYHAQTPTVNSQVYNEPVSLPPGRTDRIIVTGGVTYLFELESDPSTNLQLNLHFEKMAAFSKPDAEALLGGKAFWQAQPIPLFGGTNALQAGPLASSEEAWVEMKFQGPGTLQFRTKIRNGYSGRIFVQIISPQFRSMLNWANDHDWTPRSISLPSGTSVVRWTFSGAGIALLDSLRFEEPLPPATEPLLVMSLHGSNLLRLDVPLGANQPVLLDYSTNLLDWFNWTNLKSATSTVQSFMFAPSPEIPFQFFRSTPGE
jgi:hypothetical protein